jgi:hypothetical protein
VSPYDVWLIKTKKVPLSDFEEKRIGHIGSSESPIILGFSPWAWKPKDTQEMSFGRRMEPALLRWAAERTEQRIIRNQYRVRDVCAATHDALSRDRATEGFEAKTSGIFRGFADREEWGEPGTDQVPDYVLVQVHHQMFVSGLDVVWVPALLGGRGMVMYEVHRNESLCEIIVERCRRFWENNILADVPPEGIPSLSLAKIMHREEGKKIVLLPDPVIRWREAADKKKAAEQEERDAKAAVLAELGDAVEGATELGSVVVSKGKRKSYTVKEQEVVTVRWKKAKEAKT